MRRSRGSGRRVQCWSRISLRFIRATPACCTIRPETADTSKKQTRLVKQPMARDPYPDQKPLRELYCNLMEELKRRRNIVADVLAKKINLPQGIAVELSYLQLRMICELIALACLAAHGDIPATRSGKMQKAYAPGSILAELEKLHAQFYPVPGKQIRSQEGRPIEVKSVTSGFLTKSDLLDLWAECGDRLHRGSMKNIARPFVVDFGRIGEWDQKILTLLSHHQIQLKNPNHQLWIIMQAESNGRVHATLMEKI